MKIIEVFELPDGHPGVMQWAAEICSRLPDTYGHVLQTVARFADEDGRVCGLRQYDIARYSKVNPGKVSETLRAIEVLGPIKSSFHKKSSSPKKEKGHHKDYQLMGEYQDWTIGLSKDDLNTPIWTLLMQIGRALEREDAVQRQKLEDLVREAEARLPEITVRLEAEGRFEELSSFRDEVEALKARYGWDF